MDGRKAQESVLLKVVAPTPGARRPRQTRSTAIAWNHMFGLESVDVTAARVARVVRPACHKLHWKLSVTAITDRVGPIGEDQAQDGAHLHLPLEPATTSRPRR